MFFFVESPEYVEPICLNANGDVIPISVVLRRNIGFDGIQLEPTLEHSLLDEDLGWGPEADRWLI